MRSVSAGLAVLGILALVSGTAARGQAPTATTELEGTWEGIYSVTKGRAPFKLSPGLVTLQFQGDKLMALHLMPAASSVNGPVALGFSLNPKATPKQIDYWQNANEKIGAVYDIKGDELHIGVPESGETCGLNPPRPKAVSGEAGSCSILLVLKRK